jgi:hypothetical protein
VRWFRQLLHQYNAALSFTSLNCNITDRSVRAGVNCFQIHGELYHLQGPLDPPAGEPQRFAQLYFYNPAYNVEARLRANTQLDDALLQRLLDMLAVQDCAPCSFLWYYGPFAARRPHRALCFRILLDVREASSCNITKNSQPAVLLRETAPIIWDEVPMQHKLQ